MQRNAQQRHEAQFFLPELLAFERRNVHKQRLTFAQRFQLCILSLQAMQEIIDSRKTVECLGLHGFIVKRLGDSISSVAIGAFTYPSTKAAADVLQNMIISTTDVATATDEEKAVQLLGLLFIEIFRISWQSDPLAEKTALIFGRKPPVFNSFQWGLSALVPGTRADDASQQALSTLLVSMCQFDSARRPSLEQAIREFTQIYRDLKYVSLESYNTDIGNLLDAIIRCEHNKSMSTIPLDRYVRIHYTNIVTLFPQMTERQLELLKPYISEYIRTADLPLAWRRNVNASATDVESVVTDNVNASVTDVESVVTDIDIMLSSSRARVHIHRTHRFFPSVDRSHPDDTTASTSVAVTLRTAASSSLAEDTSSVTTTVTSEFNPGRGSVT